MYFLFIYTSGVSGGEVDKCMSLEHSDSFKPLTEGGIKSNKRYFTFTNCNTEKSVSEGNGSVEETQVTWN